MTKPIIYRSVKRTLIIPGGGTTVPPDFPGKPGGNNPVGFAAAPGFSGLTTATGWPPTLGNGGVTPGTPDWGHGISGNPTVVKYKYFDAGPSTAAPSFSMSTTGVSGGPAVHWITFVGCLFACNQITGTGLSTIIECYQSGSDNILWSYCSLAPRLAFYSSPPNGAWPSAGAGSGLAWGDPGYLAYQNLLYNAGTSFAFKIGAANPGSFVTIDHCDIWGVGIGVDLGGSAYQGTLNLVDCWIHDARKNVPEPWSSGVTYTQNQGAQGSNNLYYYSTDVGGNMGNDPTTPGTTHWAFINPSGGGVDADHTNAAGYQTGADAPSRINFRHCTLASIGNTLAASFQSASSPYSFVTLDSCYLSGFQTVLDPFHGVTGTHDCNITNNIFATDIKWVNAPIRTAENPAGVLFFNTTNRWRGNKIRVYPGDNWSGGYSSVDGQFLWPDNSAHPPPNDWTH